MSESGNVWDYCTRIWDQLPGEPYSAFRDRVTKGERGLRDEGWMHLFGNHESRHSAVWLRRGKAR